MQKTIGEGLKVWNVSDAVWERIIDTVRPDIRINGYKEVGVHKKYRQFTLRLRSERFRKVDPYTGRRIAAVCWHGHKYFFDVLFANAKGARIKTGWMGKIVYENEMEYNAHYLDSDVQVGSRMYPKWASEMCECNY